MICKVNLEKLIICTCRFDSCWFRILSRTKRGLSEMSILSHFERSLGRKKKEICRCIWVNILIVRLSIIFLTLSRQDGTKYKCKVIEKQGYNIHLVLNRPYLPPLSLSLSLSLSHSHSHSLIHSLIKMLLQVWLCRFFII